MSKHPPYTDIGPWSEIKLDIIRKYATAYSTIMSAQKNPAFHHVYVDAFAGAGVHVSRSTGEFVLGSPLNALLVRPPFKEYYFIDVSRSKVESLSAFAKGRKDVHIHEGDCNTVLIEEVFRHLSRRDYRRGLCLLDPYGLDLRWEVVSRAGRMGSIELFVNFPVVDMNRNVLWSRPEAARPDQLKRMNAFWGDESWKEVAYKIQPGLFGDIEEKTANEDLAEGFRERLKQEAGFKFVPRPIAMVNKRNSVLYYLFFASQNESGKKIVSEIFEKYDGRRRS